MYDVAIAGAGVVGAFIARELSRYELKVCILEKEHDVASGTSKANSSIVHAGYDCTPGSLKALLNVRGAQMMEQVAQELDVPYKKTGSLVAGFTQRDRDVLQELLDKGVKNGVEGLEILEHDSILKMEPNLSDEVSCALYAPSAGIVCPYELTVAAIENAVENGVKLYRDCEVKAVTLCNGHMEVTTSAGNLDCRYFVNAAGVYSGAVAAMAGDNDIDIKPRKGEYLILDKAGGSMVSSVIFQCPTPMGKGILVIPTVIGNTIIGPDAQDIDDREDTATTKAGLEFVIQGARKAVPGIDMSKVITSFAGLRARPASGDFLIKPSKINGHFIHAAGIESPGLTCAPAIGEYVGDMLEAQGLKRVLKKSFKAVRDRVIRFRELSGDELTALVKKDPSYGRLVCRCEKVTEGEVLDCIRRPGGARDLDAVKRRTRAGMGRCQGGFCSPRIVRLLSEELGIPYEAVTKKGGSSWMLAGRTK